MKTRNAVLALSVLLSLAVIFQAPDLAAQDRKAETAQTAPNPTAIAPSEAQLMQELRRIDGRVTIPDPKAAVLVQPQGRSYRVFHEGYLPWIGGIAILGMLLLLALFYLLRGRIGANDPFTGDRVLRFTLLERFAHWLTASSFIVLALTGLNYVFGKRLLFPLLGADNFAAWSQIAKYIHVAVAWPFIIGVALMIGIWIRDNLPDRYDWNWLKHFGGFFSDRHPPALRFNAGQKLVFWVVALAGTAMAASGILLLFPIWLADVSSLQWAQYVHSVIAMGFIAIMLAHIYIGTLGMVGAYRAMGDGTVDRGWAETHHSAWTEQLEEADEADGARRPELETGR